MTAEQAQAVNNQGIGAPDAKVPETNAQQAQQTSSDNSPGSKDYNWRQMEKF